MQEDSLNKIVMFWKKYTRIVWLFDHEQGVSDTLSRKRDGLAVGVSSARLL